MSNKFDRLIPELQHWNDGAGIDVGSWLSGIGDYTHAIAYGELFWPDFVEYDDCVFSVEVDAKMYDEWSKEIGGNKTELEAFINHSHIVDLFVDPKPPPSKEQARYLGCRLKEMWDAKLRRDFPDRKFIVSFPDTELEDPRDYVITFFQVR